jgi:hypothetical protein
MKVHLYNTYVYRCTGEHSNNTVAGEHPSSLSNIPKLGPSASQPFSVRSILVLASVSLVPLLMASSCKLGYIKRGNFITSDRLSNEIALCSYLNYGVDHHHHPP